MKTESGESEINFNELDSSSWDVEEKKGFELSHGCGVLFDLFHNCSSVKGRFRDYYRYGQVRSCMPYWNDFFLCMRLKMETDETKAQTKWNNQRDLSIKQRFNNETLSGESPTIGVIWEERNPKQKSESNLESET